MFFLVYSAMANILDVDPALYRSFIPNLRYCSQLYTNKHKLNDSIIHPKLL